MRHPVYRAICALILMLLLASQFGCATASTKSDTPVAPATEASESAEADSEDSAPAALPPAPADVSGMRAWFEEAYPDAAWLARIKEIKYVPGEVPSSGGYANAVVITTDLDFKTEQATGQEIVSALGEAHPAWAKQYILRYADGNNVMAGDIFDPTP